MNIIELAREANIKQAIENPHLLMVHELERFAALVRAAALEDQPAKQPLTDEELEAAVASVSVYRGEYTHAIARAIEAAHGIK